jgi:hypothetical protein
MTPRRDFTFGRRGTVLTGLLSILVMKHLLNWLEALLLKTKTTTLV